MYTYTIYQQAGTKASTYDNTQYTMTVYITRGNSDTEMTVMLVGKDASKKVAECAFTNTYPAQSVVGHNPPVKKKVSGDKPATAATFRFTFRAVSNTAGIGTMPMPEGSANGVKTVSTTPGVSKEFGEMTFTAPGQYIYQIAEVNDGQSGYTYDSSVYIVTYTVVRQGNTLTCTRAMTKDSKDVARTTVDASTDWQYAFGELPADDSYGHIYTYTVKEDPVPGYFPRYKDYDV